MSSSKNMYGAGLSEADKPLIAELAVAAMEELVTMAPGEAPLWITSTDNSLKCLDEDEYLCTFPGRIGPKDMGLKSEASRFSDLFFMNQLKLVEIMMDVNQWSTMFSGIVSRAMTIEVLSAGMAGNYDGALQVMTAEFQVPSPLVPTRENYFVRYCKKLDNKTWAVADVSLDSMRPASNQCRRRPSGCLIEHWPNGYSKVTWVEHVEVDNGAVHDIYKLIVNSGLAFGARRWVKTLRRQCERLTSAMANIPAGDGRGAIITPEGRRGMLKLAARMALSFYTGVGVSTGQRWTTLSGSGADGVNIMTRMNIDDPGKPPGTIRAATSFWIPVPPKKVFDFLRDVNSRSKWDIISTSEVQEVAQIANYGPDAGNCVSLLHLNKPNSSQIIVQESCADSTGSYVIYAPVDIAKINDVLNGGDPDYVSLLPAGFAIHPDGPGQNAGEILEVGTGGSLLTFAFQILVDTVPTEKFSLQGISTLSGLIKCTADRIKLAVVGDLNV
ncbi:Homeobox-leucine zipper protein PROTODERMAL FACTOR 2 [Heracleum sosnowskyi]|uniref:Homeobox-leucine zipper protein PROTODERMAL FACTOR 2 n=1 Tax=Heracleum sosnowskyi TaxID=360622 RepID=A0AAD8HJM9_9APIA|nr:Homeobox-leucine zipper protein PROTODERMAL FACTOR 2 [Heracleum sosnowskyi]